MAVPSALEILEERRLFSLVPVLIVPGIMGSLPREDYVRLWLQNDPLGTAPANLRPEYLTDSYDPIVDAFEQQGYTLGEDLFVATYDWRRPIGLHGVNDQGYPVNDAGGDGLPDTDPAQIDSGVEYLSYWIQRAKTLTGSDKVDIVGHSMGGLIAREYIQSDYYASDVDDFVMLGTPNQGSAKTAEIWQFGEPFDSTQDYFMSVFQQARQIYDADYRNVAGLPDGLDDFTSFLHAYVPGVRDLLPVYDYEQYVDSSSLLPRDPAENPWLDALNAPDQLAKYAARGVDATVVGARGLDTPKVLVLDDDGQSVDHYHYADGDGSVLFGYSAGTIRPGSVFLDTLPNNAADRLESEHVELLRNEDSVDAVMAALHLPALHGDFDQSTAGLLSTWWRASGWWNSGSLLGQAKAEITSHPQSIFFSPGARAVYFDSNGDKVTVSLSGPGEGEVHFPRAIHVGDRVDADALVLSGTTAASRVTVSIDRHATSIGSITVAGSLASLSAGDVKLTGALDVTGSLGSLRLGDVISGASVTIGASGGAATMAFGRVSDLSIDSLAPLTSLSATEWRDTDGLGDAVRSPWIDRLTVGGEFAPDLILSGLGLPAGKPVLGSASIAGRASGEVWDIPGDAGTISLGGDDAIINIDGSCRSLRLGDWLALIPPRDGARGSIHVGGAARVTAHGTAMPIVDGTLYVTTSSMYGLEDLRGVLHVSKAVNNRLDLPDCLVEDLRLLDDRRGRCLHPVEDDAGGGRLCHIENTVHFIDKVVDILAVQRRDEGGVHLLVGTVGDDVRLVLDLFEPRDLRLVVDAILNQIEEELASGLDPAGQFLEQVKEFFFPGDESHGFAPS